MTKEELEKEARIECFMLTVNTIGIDQRDVELAYVMGAEPREKRIAELEKRCANYEMNISKMEKGTCDVCKETEKDKKIVELETRCNELFLQTMQLTKAKEIIKKFSEFVNNEVEYDPEHPQEHTDLWNELCKEAEQFLKDSEVEK